MAEKNKRRRTLYIDIIAAAIILLSIGLFHSDLLMLCLYISAYPYLIMTGRRRYIDYLFLSTAFSVVWTYLATQQYGYNNDMLFVCGLPAFPLFAWAGGLFFCLLIYSHLARWLRPATRYKRWTLFLLTYWPLLVFLETTGYHLSDIQNITTSMYAGLPICDCMHAPHWMQAAYFLMGPAYFLAANMLLKKAKKTHRRD